MTRSDIRDPALHGILWNWGPVADALPDKCGVSDLDGVIERNGRFLVLETKRPGERLSMGQRLMLKAFARLPQFEVFILRGDPHIGHTTNIQRMNARGELYSTEWCIAQFGTYVRRWFDQPPPSKDI